MKNYYKGFYINIQNLKYLNELDHWKIKILFFKSVLSAVLVYPYVFILSILTNKIVDRSDISNINQILIFWLIIVFGLETVLHILRKIEKVRDESCYRIYKLRFGKKMMSVSFEEMDSPDFKKKLSLIHMEENYGFSLPLLFQNLDKILQGMLMFLVSIIILIISSAQIQGIHYVWMIPFSCFIILFSLCLCYSVKKTNDKALQMIRETFPPNIIINDYLTYEGGVSYKDGKDIRNYQYQKLFDECFDRAIGEMNRTDKISGTMPAIINGLSGAAKGFIMCISFIFILFVLPENNKNLGDVMMLGTTFYQLTVAVTSIFTTVSMYLAAADSVIRYLQFTEMANKNEELTSLYCPSSSIENCFALEVRNLSFEYPSSEKSTLFDISFNIKKGSKVALVGENGSGKTTLLKIICGLYKKKYGQIIVNGIEQNRYTTEKYQTNFSVIFQDFKLFAFKLGESIAMMSNYDKKEVVSALEEAGVSITNSLNLNSYLYKEYDNGIEISGGEAQKIALARALLKNAPILILDEPTAALDPLAESEFYRYISEISNEKTVLFISHRLSACRICDNIIVLEEGRVTQCGSHEELLKQMDKKYYELWSAQAKYYK